MQDFLVSPFSVAFFATSILCIFSAIYLLRIPNSSKATHYFGVFVFGLSFVFGSFAVIDMGLSPAIGKYAWWTLHLFVIGSY
jgi:hypothetical protein